MGGQHSTGGGSTVVPTFLVAGAARSGTTALVEGLRARPDVFVTTPKEPHYFALHGTRPQFRGPGDEATMNVTSVTDREAYLGLFPDGGYAAYGEGSVSTLYHHERALPEIARLTPDAKVVLLLREPVERAWSSYLYLRSQGREPEDDFRQALDDEPRRVADQWHHLWHYTGMSRYAESVSAFLDQLGPERVGIWFHDDLTRDASGTLRQVADFLELPTDVDAQDEVPTVNVSGTPRHQRLQEALWWASSRPAVRTAARTVTTWQFREAVKRRLLRRDDLHPDVRAEVAPRFTDDLVQLRALLGDRPDLPAWLRSPVAEG